MMRTLAYGSVRIIFTSKLHGNLALNELSDAEQTRKNRLRLEAQINKPIVFAHQTHSNDVALVTESSSITEFFKTPPKVDALVSARDDLALAMVVADCIPLALVDSKRGIFAAVHAGRKGVINFIAKQTLNEMTQLGSELNDVEAVIGPSICGRCYEVDPFMHDELAKDFPAISSTTTWGTKALDLKAELENQLFQLGLQPKQVHNLNICTLEDPSYFSYREGDKSSRFATIVYLEQ